MSLVLVWPGQRAATPKGIRAFDNMLKKVTRYLQPSSHFRIREGMIPLMAYDRGPNRRLSHFGQGSGNFEVFEDESLGDLCVTPGERGDGEVLAATAKMQPELHVDGGSWSVARGLFVGPVRSCRGSRRL